MDQCTASFVVDSIAHVKSPKGIGMRAIVTAALLYFAVVFGAGFLLGTIRVLVTEPRWGAFAATLCEAPFMLVAIFVGARWAPWTAGVKADPMPLVMVGLGALVLQQAADLVVGLGLRGMSLSAQLAHFATPEGKIYALLIVVFAVMPLVAGRLRP